MEIVHPQYGVEATSFDLHHNNTGILPPGRYYGFDQIEAGTGGSPGVNDIEIDITHNVTGIKPTLSDNLTSSVNYGSWVSPHGAKVTVTEAIKIYVPKNDTGSDITWYLVGKFTWSPILSGTDPIYELLSSAPTSPTQILIGTIVAAAGAVDINGLTYTPEAQVSFLNKDKPVSSLGPQTAVGQPGYNSTNGVLYLPVGDTFYLNAPTAWQIKDVQFLYENVTRPIRLIIRNNSEITLLTNASTGNFIDPVLPSAASAMISMGYKGADELVIHKDPYTAKWVVINGERQMAYNILGTWEKVSTYGMLRHVLDGFGLEWIQPTLGPGCNYGSEGFYIRYNPLMNCIQCKGRLTPSGVTIDVNDHLFELPSSYPIPMATASWIMAQNSSNNEWEKIPIRRSTALPSGNYSFYISYGTTYSDISFGMLNIPLHNL